MDLSPRKKRKVNGVSHREPVRVAFQGQEMSYTYLAAKKFFQSQLSEVDLVPHNNVADIFDHVSHGNCIYGLVPLESSSYGTIHAVYDRLLASNGLLRIVGEIGLIEQHCICVINSADVNDLDIEQIYSHPHILDCCSEYIRNLDLRKKSVNRAQTERMTAWDSAAGASLVSAQQQGANQKISAAICSKEAAVLHNLKVLVEGVGNDRNAEVCC